MVLSGQYMPVSYGSIPRTMDVLDIKGEVSALLSKFCLDNYRFIYYDTHTVLSEPSIVIEINGTYAGFFGKVREEIADKLDINEELLVCELNLRAISNGWVRDRKFSPLPKYPGVTRDLAFTVDTALPQKSVEDVIRESGHPLCTKVILFDMYSGQQTGASRKSLAYAIEFQSPDHTLTDKEIDNTLAKIIDAVQQKCNGVLRS